MPLKPQELGDRLHVDLRAGIAGIDAWRGVNREGDPACIADDELRYAQNVRLTGGKIVSRGGQTLVNSTAASGCIDGFFDAGDMGAQNPGAYVETTLYMPLGGSEQLYKIVNDDTVSLVVAETIQRLALFDDYLYWEGATGGGSTQFRRVAVGDTSAGNTFTITQIHAADAGPAVGGEANGKLWIIYGYDKTTTPSNGRIYSWDGTTAVSENSFTYSDTSSEIDPTTGSNWALTEFNDGFVAADTDVGTNRRFIYRNSAGTLSYPRFPGTFGASDLTRCQGRMAVYGSKVYMPFTHDVFLGSLFSKVVSFDGTNVTAEQTLTTGYQVKACEVFGGYLYYAYLTSTGASPDVKIGRYDGVTWTDNYVTVSSAAAATIHDLVAHNGHLYLLAGGAGAQGIWKSSGVDTSSFSRVYSANAITDMGMSVQA